MTDYIKNNSNLIDVDINDSSFYSLNEISNEELTMKKEESYTYEKYNDYKHPIGGLVFYIFSFIFNIFIG